MLHAPFTKEAVDALNKYQSLDLHHRYTCGNKTHRNHVDGDGVLKATEDGLICGCGYKQTWAHDHVVAIGSRNAKS